MFIIWTKSFLNNPSLNVIFHKVILLSYGKKSLKLKLKSYIM